MSDHDDPAATQERSPEAESRWSSSRLVPLAIIVAAGAVIAGLLFSARSEQDAGLATLGAGTVEAGSLPVTLPIRYAAGQVAVDVRLGDDKTSLPMLLDTGAPTAISDAVAAIHGGDAAGTVSTLTIDGQVTSSPVIPLRRLRVGPAEFRDVGAVETAIDREDPTWCLADAGLIGASLMRDAVWQLDYGAQRLTIAPSVEGLEHMADAIRLDFEPASDVSPSPLVSLPAGEGRLTFLVDTGSDGWLTVHPADLARIGAEVAPDAPAVATLASTAGGRVATRLAWTTADVSIGDRQLPDLPIAATTVLPEGQGVMGNAFLDHFVVTIDWPAGALYLDPVTGDPRPDVPVSVSPTWHDGYVVGSIVEGAPGTAGLALDVPILAVDGQDVSRATVADFCSRLAETTTHASSKLTIAGEPARTLISAPVDGFFGPLHGRGLGSGG